MAGQRCLYGNLRSFQIADFTDHDDVRILPQNRAQCFGKRHVYARIDLGLSDPGQFVFDRVFDRQDVGAAFIQPRQCGIQGGGLAGAGGAGDQHDAVRLQDQLVKLLQHVCVHAQMLHVELIDILVEQAQYRAFAMSGGQRGNPHIDSLAAHPQRDAAILRQAFFGNVQLRHNLDARNQRGMNCLLRTHYIAQTTVNAKAHHRNLLERFDMNIRCAFAQCLGQQRIDRAYHRRVIRRFQQVFYRRHIQHQLGQIEIGLIFINHLGRIAAGAGIGFGDGRFERRVRHGFQPDAPETTAHFRDRTGGGRIRDQNFDRIICTTGALRQQREVTGKGIREKAGVGHGSIDWGRYE